MVGCLELGTRPASSVTAMAAVLAAEIIARHFPRRFEKDEPVVWIEHLPDRHGDRGGRPNLAKDDRVSFATWTPRRVGLGTPTWRRLQRHEVAALIDDAETEAVG